ncbi:hypothetical protein [Roseovarius sp.]|uniref:hypothetical protein n=1 Tax=Roseovarius sp. TaxID=1486281 RepID=UPI003D0A4E01
MSSAVPGRKKMRIHIYIDASQGGQPGECQIEVQSAEQPGTVLLSIEDADGNAANATAPADELISAIRRATLSVDDYREIPF